MLKLIADETMPAVETLFGSFAEIERLPGRQMTAEQVQDADILLVRSITKVDSSLLAGAKRLRFVGSATIGIDHLDTEFLNAHDLSFSNAPGCNAQAVVDYTLSAILNDCQDQERELSNLTVGVVGCGNVGSLLVERLGQLGVNTLCCDPPRRVEDGFNHTALERVVEQADICCLHTPLTYTGACPTHHLFDYESLMRLKSGALLLNAGRGAVIDNKALMQVADQRPDLRFVLDVWESEPQVDRRLAERCYIATPHIAGHSIEGKLRGTWMLYQQVCRLLEREADIDFQQILPRPEVDLISVTAQTQPLKLMQLVYDQWHDDRRFRRSLNAATELQREAFDRLRKFYPGRREFSSLRVSVESTGHLHELRAFGFNAQLAENSN